MPKDDQKQNKTSKGIEYSKQVVFFIDVLAFKDMILGKNKRTADEIALILEKINSFVDNNKYVTQFSDSIVLSFKYNKPSGLFFTILDILHLQFELFHNYKVLLRGACYLGDAYHDDKFCFGEAVIGAYLLQEKCAIYPRIIISEDIIEQCSAYSIHQDYNEENDIKKILKQDTDGYWYIDYFSYEVVDTEMDQPECWGLYIIKIREIIEQELKKSDISVKQKYLWLKDKYNKALSDTLINNYKNNFEIELQKIF